MAFTVEYLLVVVERDIPKLDKAIKDQIQASIELKLTHEPRIFGKPLRYSKKGSWTLRIGHYRVIYTVDEQVVLVSAIGHRKDVYER
jgi:mRNA interferase RelE/StbE